jgi:hypothetical protein
MGEECVFQLHQMKGRWKVLRKSVAQLLSRLATVETSSSLNSQCGTQSAHLIMLRRS